MRPLLLSLLIVVGSLAGACALPAPAPPAQNAAPAAAGEQGTVPAKGAAEGFNIVQAADLEAAVAIEVDFRKNPGVSFETVAQITGAEEIEALLTPLDQPLPLRPRVFCSPQYQIRVQRADGSMQELSYFCSEEDLLLYGDVPGLGEQAVEPPAAFVDQVEELAMQP